MSKLNQLRAFVTCLEALKKQSPQRNKNQRIGIIIAPIRGSKFPCQFEPLDFCIFEPSEYDKGRVTICRPISEEERAAQEPESQLLISCVFTGINSECVQEFDVNQTLRPRDE
jgi:hypothetical protein